MPHRARVAVVDDHPIFREGVVYTLKATKLFDVVAVGGSMDEAVAIAAEKKPDIMLLDISMPGGGIAAASQIAGSDPAIKLIMLTVSEREEDVTASLQAGVRAYLLKGTSGPEFTRVVEAVKNGESYVSPGLAARLLSQLQGGPAQETAGEKSALTAREEAILEQVSLGLTNKEVARNLSVSEKTVKHYMTNIMNKLNVRNRVEAVLMMRNKERGGG